ncbi:tripartite tricarboxylate transporter substrate-binding protein [Roseococcus pinisoli]|uniref:Tripartite tricarboxylate transporter substrate binding protein n=1 Tax=Roseococcus pinisoli TaxID=2835040 RepID=A0ABS5QKN3_9PROT|nr:tripartite tricarboxylate transporter substrate-binding protein [Roseococcus pinisoli]MBS7813667.1 tripartite tricarboxylate transporter substrate binding protein [Roseococcus pinisoli]
MRRRQIATAALNLALLAAGSGAARAQGGSGPLTLIVPFPPGGIVDTIGRLLAHRVGQILNQATVVENRAGAGSAIGAAQVASSRPDGQTILFGGIPQAIIPSLQPNLQPSDPLAAFAAVGTTHTTPYILHVHRGLPVNTVQEFVAWAKARPGQINAATTGQGAGPHLTWELFSRTVGIQAEIIHHRGGVPAILDIQANRAQVMFSTALEAIQAQRAEQSRPIAVTSAERLAILPDLPTLAESGLPGFDVLSWGAWYAPAGSPAPVLARISAALEEALQDPAIRARFDDLGVTPAYEAPEASRARLASELNRWGRLIREARLQTTS